MIDDGHVLGSRRRGGGHADYYGNELYAFDVPSRSWRWRH
jgi:hypothetical protein